MGLCSYPGGETFPERGMAEGPAGLAEWRGRGLEEVSGERLQGSCGPGGRAACAVDDVALCLVEDERVAQAAVWRRGIDEGERSVAGRFAPGRSCA
jgi:hypothetical protein